MTYAVVAATHRRMRLVWITALLEQALANLALRDGKPTPWYELARSVIKSRWAKSLEPKVTASVASIPEGGRWTQDRLYAAGLADDPFCKSCLESLGTLAHRMFMSAQTDATVSNSSAPNG